MEGWSDVDLASYVRSQVKSAISNRQKRKQERTEVVDQIKAAAGILVFLPVLGLHWPDG